MPYYGDLVQELESIRSSIKHLDPTDVPLDNIRDILGHVILDLQVLQSLRRPHSYKLQRSYEETEVTVTIEIKTDEAGAEDMIRKLWMPDS